MFKDRKDAGKRLVEAIKKQDPKLLSKLSGAVAVSLLRGGIIVGDVVAKELGISHYPLIVAKISAPFPHSAELAIGALCGDIVYREARTLRAIGAAGGDIDRQIAQARNKQKTYLQRFQLQRLNYGKIIRKKTILLIDDGIATGSTVRAAALFIQSKKPKRIVLAVPVAPQEFALTGFDQTIILRREAFFSAVGQFYQHFPEVTDRQVQSLLKSTL